MLVLVAGATGNIGQKLLLSLLARGHRVRALARNPEKIPAKICAQLDRIVRSTSYHDIAALDAACEGIDAVICAYNGIPELQVEGQLFLLRAAERGGAGIYVSASWNADWRGQKLGDHDSYDGYHCFNRLAQFASAKLRPHFIFCGILAEVLFSAPGRVSFAPANHGVWDPNPEAKRVEIWGEPGLKWHWTSEGDAAEFAAAIVDQPEDVATKGGFWSVCSGYDSLEDIAKIYENVRGKPVEVKRVGSVEELREKAFAARANSHPTKLWDYIGYFYVLYIVDGTWKPAAFDNEKLGVKGTPLEEFLEQNPDI
jgi:nucleoside-diphosphate-sugar epimerase